MEKLLNVKYSKDVVLEYAPMVRKGNPEAFDIFLRALLDLATLDGLPPVIAEDHYKKIQEV